MALHENPKSKDHTRSRIEETLHSPSTMDMKKVKAKVNEYLDGIVTGDLSKKSISETRDVISEHIGSLKTYIQALEKKTRQIKLIPAEKVRFEFYKPDFKGWSIAELEAFIKELQKCC